tara:strand:+ start:35 stop:580 length:546 start_codon:yes stop_codon:yes gene_type:complete
LNRPFNRNNNFRGKKDLHKINNFISSEEVRVILDDGEQLGVMNKKEAISIAQDRGMDLVEIAPNNKPPVCKIVDYGKFKYQEQKKKNEAKKKQKVIETKELKIRPGTGEHDYQVKIKNAQKFLKEGNRVKFSLRFKGREMEHSNLGIEMLKRVKNDLEDIIRVEMEPKIEGRQAFLVVAPK